MSLGRPPAPPPAPDIISLFTKLTMALAGWSSSSSANTWHWLQPRAAGFRATKANSLLGGLAGAPSALRQLHRRSSGSTPQCEMWLVAWCFLKKSFLAWSVRVMPWPDTLKWTVVGEGSGRVRKSWETVFRTAWT